MNSGEAASPHRPVSWGWLGVILMLAAGLRMVGLDRVPPGLSADEASNAYDGYCLLKTGQDRWGERWPVVLRAFGDADYRPAMMAYLTVPFQVAMGPRGVVTAARLPTALVGVTAVLCVYLLGRAAFGERVGLLAALLLALCPWHIVLSRLAHESGLTPLFPPLILVLLAWGGMPLDGTTSRGGVRWAGMVLAGVVVGLSVYTYATAKLLIPALLLVVVVVYRRWFAAQLRTSRGCWVLVAAVLAALVVAGPMVRVHLTEWPKVNARAYTESLLHREATMAAALGIIARQYAAHFGPDWLFVTGHPCVDLSPRGFGQFNWYMLPLLLAGLAAMVRGWRANRAHALLLAWLLLYPIASATTKGGGNAARAACGLAVFPLIGAVGLAAVLHWWIKTAALRTGATVVAVVAIVALGGRFAYHYFAIYPSDPEVHARYQAEFRPAMDYLRDRRDVFDHVFVSDTRSVTEHLWFTSEAYIYPLVYLPIEPADFHIMPKVEVSPPGVAAFHFIARVGDFTFTLDRRAPEEYAAAFPQARVLLLARPGQVEGGQVVGKIHRPDREPDAPREVCLQLVSFDLGRERPRVRW